MMVNKWLNVKPNHKPLTFSSQQVYPAEESKR